MALLKDIHSSEKAPLEGIHSSEKALLEGIRSSEEALLEGIRSSEEALLKRIRLPHESLLQGLHLTNESLLEPQHLARCGQFVEDICKSFGLRLVHLGPEQVIFNRFSFHLRHRFRFGSSWEQPTASLSIDTSERDLSRRPFASVKNRHMNADIQTEFLSDDGTFPNNARLPVIIYRNAMDSDTNEGGDRATLFEERFRRNGWGGTWRNGIYPYHHYHSTAHEVLGVARGSARVQLGGDSGIRLDVDAGDALVLPAGTAHKNLGSSPDFVVVGAYPKGQSYDMNYGEEGERPRADQNIESTSLPEADPVFGADGPLMQQWA